MKKLDRKGQDEKGKINYKEKRTGERKRTLKKTERNQSGERTKYYRGKRK